jgi:hypothetical protein
MPNDMSLGCDMDPTAAAAHPDPPHKYEHCQFPQIHEFHELVILYFFTFKMASYYIESR